MSEAKTLVMTKLDPIEKTRVYTFPKGEKAVFVNVCEFGTREGGSGTHRLKTADGKLHIVNTGWLTVELDTGEFTV